jgi:hypothetical protein
MKKFVFLLALVAASGSTLGLVHAQPLKGTVSATYARTYAEGQVDGEDYAASLAAQYGYGTPDYQNAVDAASATARYNARNSEEPTYWRGYNTGLTNY